MVFFKRLAAGIRNVLPTVAFVAVVLAGTLPALAQDWVITKIDGREYVSIDAIKKFYGFHSATKSGNSILLSSADAAKKSGILMKLQVGSQECLINNVKFIFTNNVEPGASLGLVSRMD